MRDYIALLALQRILHPQARCWAI